MWDVFICHAWEDKETIARPLAYALKRAGLKVWYDEFTLKIGDSLRRSIDLGLSQSKYGVVILSPHFFAKEWPQRELDGLVAREINSGKVILPVWHNVTREDVESFSPILADRLSVSTIIGLNAIVQEIRRVIHPQDSIINRSRSGASTYTNEREIYAPITLITVIDSNFRETLQKHNLVVVDMWATWSKPCKMVESSLKALAKKMVGEVVFAKLNVDENPRTTTKYQVMSIPTLLIFKDGVLVKRIVGIVSQEHIERQIREFL